MKTLSPIATLLLLFTAYNSFSQDISITDFLQLRATSTNAVESKLNSLNIELYDSENIGNGKTHYTYQNSDALSAFQWVDFISTPDAHWDNRLSFQIQNIELVKKYLTEMKALGFYFTGKKVVDRQIYEMYTDGFSIIELITSQSKKGYDNNMYFNFAFYNAVEYQYAFADENKKYVVPEINQTNLFAELIGVTDSKK